MCNNFYNSRLVFLTVSLFVSRITQILLLGSSGKNKKMDLSPTYIPLSFKNDLDHHLDTKKINLDFSIFLLLHALFLFK